MLDAIASDCIVSLLSWCGPYMQSQILMRDLSRTNG